MITSTKEWESVTDLKLLHKPDKENHDSVLGTQGDLNTTTMMMLTPHPSPIESSPPNPLNSTTPWRVQMRDDGQPLVRNDSLDAVFHI
jgi:hypothetical protein